MGAFRGLPFFVIIYGNKYDEMISLDKYLNTKSLFKHKSKYSPSYKMTDEEKTRLIELDKEFGDYFRHFREHWTPTESTNVEQEWVKFKKAKDKGEKYYPQIKLYKDELDRSFLEWSRRLKNKFEVFPCYLSRFYVDTIDYVYHQAVGAVYRREGDPIGVDILNTVLCPKVSEENYKAAWKMLEENPYRDVRDEQNYNAKDIIPMMQEHIDKCGFSYKAVLNDHMIARQNVQPHVPELRINSSAVFSDIDVASLKVHEVEVHIGRRHYGFMTGLNLFVDGLPERNTLDEGMAIFQSLNYNPLGVKPNLQFDIAIKTVMGYHMMDMDIHEIYDMLLPKLRNEQNKNVIERIIFKNLMRFKRIVQDSSLYGGDAISEEDYFCGYMMVKDLPKSLKTDIIKWNVGPKHIKDIPNLKKFFKVNKFKPLV